MFKIIRTIHFFSLKSHFQSSISPFSSSSSQKLTATPPTSSIVKYLINSLGFNKDEAIAVSSEVPHLKSTSNPALIVKIFKEYGLHNDQIRSIVSVAPKILTVNPNKTLAPKLRVFKELGLPSSDLVKLLKRNRFIFRHGLHTQIIPTVDYLRKLLGCDEKVVEMINNSKWLFLTNKALQRTTLNVSLLQKYGLSNEKISKYLATHPQHMMQTTELVESKVQYIETKLGISRNSTIFIHGLAAVMYRSELQIEKNIQIFKSFGWSDFEIASLLRAQPYCLSKSESYISDKLNFFIKEMNYTPSYLMGCTPFWTLSLEKRLKPRNEVLKILKEKELMKQTLCFSTIVNYTESKFLSFLKSFESHVPGLCETYKNSVGNSKLNDLVIVLHA